MKKSVRFRVHPAGAAMLAGAFCFCPSAEVLAVLGALLLHEGGHMIAMILCQAQDCVVEITPFGGMTDCRSMETLLPGRQMICAGAGVLASAGAFLILHMLHAEGCLASAFAAANFSLAAINCLPVWPLDGARVLTALASCVGLEELTRRMLSVLAKITGTGLTALGLYGAWKGSVNVSLLLCGPYLCYTSALGDISCRVRKMNQIRQKLSKADFLTVQPMVCPDGKEKQVLSRILGRSEWGRYQIIYLVDPQSGRIIRTMSEQEALEDIVGP